MADAYKRIVRTSFSSATAATVYTVPGSTTTQVGKIVVSNDSGTTGTAKIHHVESGGSPDATNIIIPEKTIADNEHIVDDASFIMETGDTIQVIGDGTQVMSISAYGIEMS